MFKQRTVAAALKQTKDFPFEKHAPRFRNNCSKKEKKFIENQKTRGMRENGICSIPSQCDMETCSKWLEETKKTFEKNANKMMGEWKAMVGNWKALGKTPKTTGVHGEYLTWYKKWNKRSGINIIALFEANNFEHHETFDTLDMRMWKVLYKKSWPKHKKTQPIGNKITDKKTLLEHLEPAVAACYENLLHVLHKQEKLENKQEYFPEISEISLLAWGTCQQPMHSDFAYTAEDGTQSYPKENPLKKW